MKEIVAKTFIAASLLDVLDMHDEPCAREVREFVKAHAGLGDQFEEELEKPATEEVIKEVARAAAREVLELLKQHVGETA